MDSVLSRPAPEQAAPAPGVLRREWEKSTPLRGHFGLVYRTPGEFVREVSSFVAGGVESGERVLVALPGEKIDVIRSALTSARDVRFVDMYWSGRNPARMIPTIRSFLDEQPGRRARLVGEPLWPGRSSAEIAEVAETEFLSNLAFRDDDVAVLCPYDASLLSSAIVRECCENTHPHIIEREENLRAGGYDGPGDLSSWDRHPLEPPPPEASVTELGIRGLGRLRVRLNESAKEAGLSPSRTADLVLAATEVATNALVHGSGRASVRIWVERERPAVVCEVSDRGRISDPLVGRRRPAVDAEGSRGLWLVNQLCDLVQLRSGEQGTVVRMRFDGATRS